MKQLLELAQQAAREAGRVIMSYYHEDYEVREKGEGNPVTTADLEANRVLHRVLLEGAPGTGWLSEETVDSAERLGCGQVWVVDPIDGTKEFIDGIPEFAISIGLAEEGRIVAGVIFNPPRDEMFAAARGDGASRNGAPIRVTSRTEVQGARVAASRSESRRGEFEPFQAAFDVRPIGSIAYKLARVAEGFADATWSLGPKNEWDIAAGVLLVEEAGGRATDQLGQGFRFNRRDPLVPGILASNGVLHDAVVRAVAPEVERRRAPSGA